MKKIILLLGIISFLITSCMNDKSEYLLVSSGAGLQTVLDDLHEEFTKQTGIEVKTQYLCTAMVLSSITLTQESDIFFSGSEYYMDKAIDGGLVLGNTKLVAGQMIPVITTPKGNPANVTKLEDFLRPDIKLGFGDFENLATGRLTKKILLAEGLYDKIQENIEYIGVSPAKIQTVVSLGHLDAAINIQSEVLKFKDTSEIIYIPDDQMKYSLNCCAITSYSKKKKAAQKYLDFMQSDFSQNIWKEKGFALPDGLNADSIERVN